MSQSRESDKKFVAGLYNRVADSFDQVGPETFGRFGRILVQEARLEPGAAVLDVCTGRGANLFPAIQAVGKTGLVVGVDLASQMVRQTAQVVGYQELEQQPLLLCMDAEQLAFPDASFDALLCGFAIFFLDASKALTEWKRVLRPAGRLAISVSGGNDPRWDWYEAELRQYRDQYQIPLSRGSSGLHQPDEIARALIDTGYADVAIHTHALDIQYPDVETWWQAKWTHGSRQPLEHFPPEILSQFKNKVCSIASQTDLVEQRVLACILGKKLSE